MIQNVLIESALMLLLLCGGASLVGHEALADESASGPSSNSHTSIRVIVFPGGFNLPIWAAQHNGFFKDNDIDVQLSPTRSSVDQITGLMRGDYDVAMTAMDNIVAYQEGQGQATFENTPDMLAFMGGDDAFLHLVVQQDVHDYADLRGKTLSVDSLTTGFAFVLRRMLENGGLARSDYSLEPVGGVMQRWEELQKKNQAGTLVLTPFEILAPKVGLRVLQSASDVIPRYQGVVGATRRSWAASHGWELVAYIRGYVSGLQWLFDPNNRDAAIGLLLENVRGMDADMAAAAYEIFVSDDLGFEPQARLDLEGVQAVLELRSRYGLPRKELSDGSQYYDLSYYEAALKSIH